VSLRETSEAPRSNAMERVILLAFLAITIEALYCIPRAGLEFASGGRHPALLTVLAFGMALVMGALAWTRRDAILGAVRQLSRRAIAAPWYGWLALVLCLGLALRLGWLAVFPTELHSDGKTYFWLARHLYETGTYRDDRGDYAWWPPGYPFFLLGFMRIFGVHPWIPILANLLLYCGVVPLAWGIGKLAGGEGAGRLATLLVAVWPNPVFTVGTGSKELLLAFLLPLAILAYARSGGSGKGAGILLRAGAGGALALGALTQPSILLFPFLLVAYDLLQRETVRAAALRCLPMIALFGIVVGAWSYRNYRVLHAPVLIATNGGSVFYLANNPKANGGYSEEGERSLDGLTEVERNRTGFRMALEWIRSEPGSFLRLVLKKHLYFLGDDSMGAYETLKRGLDISDARYLVAKGLSNLFWLLLWILIWTGLVAGGKPNALTMTLMLSMLYFYFVDSMFEAGSRHHVPALALIAALALAGAGAPAVVRPAESGPA